MKAVIHSRYGNAEVLQVTTLERPVPQKNEVLIRVQAAGIDVGQWLLMSATVHAARASVMAIGAARTLPPKQASTKLFVGALAFGWLPSARGQSSKGAASIRSRKPRRRTKRPARVCGVVCDS